MALRLPMGRGSAALLLGLGLAFGPPARAEEEEQDAETKALDSTATQWSFRVAYHVRVGKFLVTETGRTWNFYAEYQTSVIYDSYPGPAVENSIRVNATYAIPVSF